MNFSALSIRNPIPAIILFSLLTLGGLLAYHFNAVQDFPDVELPVVTIKAALPGATPAQIETQVVRKIEGAVASLQGVKNIYSTIHDSQTTITIEFVLEKQISEAVNDVRNTVVQMRADLPSALADPVVTKIPTAGNAVLTFIVAPAAGMENKIDEQELSWFVDNTVTKRLLAVPGLGAIRRIGGVTREVQIELDAVQMRSLKTSVMTVSRQLQLLLQEEPGGRIDIGGAKQSIRTSTTVKTAAELASLDIPLQNGRSIQLAQVASIKDTVAEPRTEAMHNGRKVVGFEILRTKGASEIAVANSARVAVTELQAAHPSIRLEQVIDNTAPIKENFAGSMHLLYEGALLTILVVWWFLCDWRATLVSAAALPFSAIPTFLGMFYFGYTLNIVTLLALALVVGVLVDDAIVEIENIMRHLQIGKTPMQAVLDATDEIGMAVIATTFALVAVFLPTAFMSGIPGLFFKQFGWTAVLAILVSLVVARLLTPMMAAYMLKPSNKAEKKDGWIMQRYLAIMQCCLRYRLLTAVGATLFCFASLALVPLLPTGFIPPGDRNQTQIHIELPPGSTLGEARSAAEHARLAAGEINGIKDIFSVIGDNTAEVRHAVLTLSTVHRSDRTESLTQLEAQIRDKLTDIPGIRFKVGRPEAGGKMQLVLYSEDPVALAETAQKVERELRTLHGIGNVNSSVSLVRQEIVVHPDFAKAADLGVTSATIGEALRVATMGDYDLHLPKLNLSERQVPIRLKLPDITNGNLAALERLTVPGKDGPIMLGNIATVTLESGPAQIDRLNRNRNVILEVELGKRSLGELYIEARALPSMRNLPSSVKIAELGDAREMQALFANFGIAMLIGVLCIYGVLVLLFKGFMQPITILTALPLSIGGAFIALLLTGKSLSMPSIIGLIMLMGIVTKNSILLVDYTILARRLGMNRSDALLDACHKRSRPILMTTIAMGAGMMPLALGWGADPSFRSPMAVALIGGLITSTLLSLIVVPAVYTYIDDLESLLTRFAGFCRSKE